MPASVVTFQSASFGNLQRAVSVARFCWGNHLGLSENVGLIFPMK